MHRISVNSEQMLGLVVNKLPVVVYAIDAAGTVILSEGRALELMGSGPGLAVGRSVFDVFADEPDALGHIRLALAGHGHDAEIVLRRNRRLYRVWYTPSFDAEGRVEMVMGLSLEITQPELNHRELEWATRWLQNLIARLPVAIFRVDAEGFLTYAEGSVLPEGAAMLIGRPVADGLPDCPHLMSAIESAQAGRDQAASITREGRSYELLVNAMRDEAGSQGVLGVVIEVTEQRKAAEGLLESEQRSRFLAAISHELRTPLNSILGFAQLLLQPGFGSLDDRQHRYVTNINYSGQQLLELINELLDLSKLQAGEFAVGVQPVATRPVIDQVVERMMPIAEAKGVELRKGPWSPALAAADPRRLAQIFQNLISNAIKFTPAGGRVVVTCARRASRVEVEVADTGVGIEQESLERIFEEFYQVPREDGEEATGTGLGLALSRRLARAMGGDLTVRSSAGRGSTFRLVLRKVESES